MLLVGYLENICSDRALERLFQLRLDLLYFIDHDLGDPNPDHSTICKARKRIPKEIFDVVFIHVLRLCVDAGLVGGIMQSIDSAYIIEMNHEVGDVWEAAKGEIRRCCRGWKASIDRMAEIKYVNRNPRDYLKEILAQSST